MKWNYDPGNSMVEWAVKHLGIATVKGRFRKVDARLDLEGDDPTQWRVEVTIDADSIDSGNERRDNDIKGPRYLDVATYPTITFKTSSVERAGDHYRMHGDLTVHGVTRRIELEGTFNGQATDPRGVVRRGFSVQTTIKRSDFNVHPSGQESGPFKPVPGMPPFIGEDVRIAIEVEASLEVPAAEPKATA